MGKPGEHSIASLFFSGAHREVADATIDAPSPSFPREHFEYVVGALVMLGRVSEAETSFLLHGLQLTPAQKSACRFFLGLGFCRHSYYDKSRRYFADNVLGRHEAPDSISRFYRFQGLAFYHYFSGRIRKALRSSEKSFEAAFAANFLYGRAFAADLKGHALVHVGEVGLGLRTLELAEHLASQLGARWLQETIQSSVTSYHARFGIDSDHTLPRLLKHLRGLSKQDVYTQSSLLLELSQEYIRRGKLAEAKQALNDCCRIVYASRNRRHAAMLNLRYAYIHYLEGDSHLAMNLVRTAVSQIDPQVDVLLEVRLRGFERKLVKDLKLEVCTRALDEWVPKHSKQLGEAVALRMLSRESAEPPEPVSFGEDRIGDLWDEIARKGIRAADSILQRGYYGLLSEILPIPRGAKALYLDLEPSSLTVFEKGSVRHFPKTLTPSLRALLMAMTRGPQTKEDLIRDIWKYPYHPLRHDTLIYSAIAKLRKILGSYSHWIEASEVGYHLRSDIHVVAHSSPVGERIDRPSFVEGAVPPANELNHRQQKILQFLDANDNIDTATCRKLFDTSEITASRDLSELLRLTLIGRIGRGRATKYVLRESPQSERTPQ